MNDLIPASPKANRFSHVSQITYLPRWCVLMIDLVLVLLSFTVSYLVGERLLAYNPHATPDIFPIWQQCLIVMATQTIFFVVLRTYAGILRFSTFMDTIRVAASSIFTVSILLIVNLVCRSHDYSPFLNSLLILYMFVSIVALFAWRVSVKTAFEFLSHNAAGVQKVMIYGVQSTGLSLAKMLQSNMDSKYRPVGFITDDLSKVQHNLLGLRVYQLGDDVIRMMQRKNIQAVLVSPAKMQAINPLVDLAIFLDNGIRVLTTPDVSDFNPDESDQQTKQRIGAIQSIRVEDLLERPAISINTENVKRILTNQVVMITGAAGSIGSEIVRQVARYKPRLVVLFETAESPLHDLSMDLRTDYPKLQFARVIGDVRNLRVVEEAFEEYRPSVVFHAAAYKHVPLMEEFPQQAVLANVLGTKNVADMSVKYGVSRFVMISTDKAVNPTNVMGASKRVAEIYVQSLFNHLHADNPDSTRFITTRFGNVLGSNGSVVPFFKKQIAAGGPVTVTHPDIIRYFMTIPEASTLVLEAATLGNGGEIFCFDMGQPVKIADLAKNMIRLAGYEPGRDIKITYTGLRPGEKLYEELLNQKETTLPTPNEKIKIARVREFAYEEVLSQIEAMIAEAQNGKAYTTVALMKKLVPEFKSKNSVYEQLDR